MMPSPPTWLEELANAVALQMTPADLMAPIGCHYCFVEPQWEITLFAAKTEIVGGDKDGVRRASKFSVDIKEIAKLFSEVASLNWQALPVGGQDDLGSHLSLEGLYEGKSVWLRILSNAPRRFNSGRQAHVYEQEWKEAW